MTTESGSAGERVEARPTDEVRDVRCARCQYDLRGLDATGGCPECGGPVWLSTTGDDRLSYAAPDWLARLVRGGRWLGLSTLGLVIFGMIWWAEAARSAAPSSPGFSARVALDIALGGAAACFLLGVRWILAPEPRRRAAECWNSSRRLAKFGLSIGAVWVLAVLLVQHIHLRPGLGIFVASVAFFSPMGLVSAIGTCAFGFYLQHLAARAGNCALASRFHNRASLYGVIAIANLLGTGFAIVFEDVPAVCFVLICAFTQFILALAMLLAPLNGDPDLAAVQRAAEAVWAGQERAQPTANNGPQIESGNRPPTGR